MRSTGSLLSMNSTEIGSRTEGIILAALLRSGRNVLLPFGGGLRYDLVIESEGKFQRVQCKTAVMRGGCVIFNSCSQGGAKGGTPRKNYLGDADLFGVYCPTNDMTYLIPVEDVATNEGRLRVEPPRNNQRVRLAESYLI